MRKTLAVLGAAAAALALASGPAQAKEYKVGLLLPFSGVYAGLGSHIENGFNLGLEHFGGDLGGHTITLAREDTEAKPATGLVKAKKLVLQDKVDVIVGPTMPNTAWRLEETEVKVLERKESVLAISWRLTYPFNLTGLPAISLPCGFDGNDMPIGLQIAAKPFDETTLLRVAQAYERSNDWVARRPKLWKEE